jgi:hypothetical protein
MFWTTHPKIVSMLHIHNLLQGSFMKLLLIALSLAIGPFAFSQNADQKETLHFSTPYTQVPEFAITFVSSSNWDNETITILLSDGSLWNVNAEFVESLAEWQQGDEIRWALHADTDEYLLKNMRSKTILMAELDFSVFPSNSYVIENIDVNGYLIETKGGEKWSVGYFGSFTSCHWRKGDRLIINKSKYSRCEDYCLINLNEKNDVWASLVRYQY